MEAGAAGGTGVVGVVDWDAVHAELVEDALAGCGVAVAVAGDACLNVVVVDLCIEHGFGAGFKAEFWVLSATAWFDELGHAYA